MKPAKILLLMAPLILSIGCDDDSPDVNCLSCYDSGVADAGQEDAQATAPHERGGAEKPADALAERPLETR